MKKKFRIQAFSSDPRHSSIEIIQKLIDNSKGYLMNYKMFSDMQMTLYFEIKEYLLLNFYHRLRKHMLVTGFDLDNYDPHSKQTCRVYLNVSFVKAKGKLRLKIPKVPG